MIIEKNIDSGFLEMIKKVMDEPEKRAEQVDYFVYRQ